jgi:hypothetical protein
VGFEFAKNLCQLVPSVPRWKSKLNQLQQQDAEPGRRDSRPLLVWCDENFGELMRHVPIRRRESFAKGFFDATDCGTLVGWKNELNRSWS